MGVSVLIDTERIANLDIDAELFTDFALQTSLQILMCFALAAGKFLHAA